MLTLKSPDKAEQFVRRQTEKGNDVRWDGWDIVFFAPNDSAFYSRNGAYRNGTWGFENRATVNTKGEWEVDRRDVLR
jgi:hypothetical protein